MERTPGPLIDSKENDAVVLVLEGSSIPRYKAGQSCWQLAQLRVMEGHLCNPEKRAVVLFAFLTISLFSLSLFGLLLKYAVDLRNWSQAHCRDCQSFGWNRSEEPRT